jgi:hypothetical protein
MAHRIDAAFQLLLPDNPKEMATALAEVAAAWAAFTASLDQYQAELKFSVNDVRTSTPLYKRGRKNAISQHAAGKPFPVPQPDDAA